MSDAEVTTTAEGDPNVVDQPQDESQEQPSGDSLLVRIGGLPFHEAINVGDVTVTREGTEVPAELMPQLQQVASENGFVLEVVPE